MSKSKYVKVALAATVALPTIAQPAVAASQKNAASSKGTIIVAQTKTSTKTQQRNAKAELSQALKRMPPAEKAKLGPARYNKLQNLTGAQLVRAGCFTHGVGCGGTPQFSQGVICCAIIKTTI